MNDLQNWKESLKQMNFDEYTDEMKSRILNSNMDNDSKKQFNDCYEYFKKLYKSGKPLEANLLKIYLEEIKGYKNIKMEEFIRIVILLGFCGFQIKYDKK